MADIDFPLLENEGGTFSDIQIRTIKREIKEGHYEMQEVHINAHKVILGSISPTLTKTMMNYRSVLDFFALDIDYQTTMCILALTYNTKRLLDKFPLSILNDKQKNDIWAFLVSIKIIPNQTANRLVSNLLKHLDLKEIRHLYKYLAELTDYGWKFELGLSS